MRISVLGCGRWGSFLAWYLQKNGMQVLCYGPEDDVFNSLKKTRRNEFVTLSEEVILTSSLEEAIVFSDIVIISIPSQQLRGFLEKINKFSIESKKFILCMKGIEEHSGKRLTEIAIECGIDKSNLAVWVGPGHIQDFVKGIPNCMIIDGYNKSLVEELVEKLKSPLIRFYYGSDIIGSEIGAATKNIMGIVAGLLDGAGYSSLKGALMARGAREVARLIQKLGGNELSAFGLGHLGDYEATLFSPHSHNRAFGESLVKNTAFCKLAEGIKTCIAATNLAKKHGVDMPITFALNELLLNKYNPFLMLEKLFGRDIRKEF